MVRSVDWLAAPEATAPAIRLILCACSIPYPAPLVTPPKTSCEALAAAVSGVMSVTPVHWMARKAKTKPRMTARMDMPTFVACGWSDQMASCWGKGLSD